MNPSLIFLPSFALVLISYAVLAVMFRARVAAMKKHRSSMQAIADPEKESVIFRDAVNPADNFENLYEMPVLFFVASGIIFALGKVDHYYLVGCWAYVVLRAAHSFVHCTSNRILYRFRFFALSALVLLLLWIRIAYQILSV